MIMIKYLELKIRIYHNWFPIIKIAIYIIFDNMNLVKDGNKFEKLWKK